MPAVDTRAGALHVFLTPVVGFGKRLLMVPIRTIPGVILGLPFSDVLGASDRNGIGKAALRAEGDGNRLSWRAPGSNQFGPSHEVNVDSDVLLEDGGDRGKFVQARVKTAYLQPQPIERPVYLQERWNNNFLDVAAAAASAGAVKTISYTAENRSGTSLVATKVWLDASAPYLSISVDGVGYSTPTTEAAGLLLLGSGGSAPGVLFPGAVNNALILVKRTIPPATTYNPKVLMLLHFRFEGI